MTAIFIYKNILRYNLLLVPGEKLQGHDMTYVFRGSFGVGVGSDDETVFYECAASSFGRFSIRKNILPAILCCVETLRKCLSEYSFNCVKIRVKIFFYNEIYHCIELSIQDLFDLKFCS